MSSAPAIELENVSKAYADGGRTLEVLRGVDLTVRRGELVAVVGRSGSGKSTLLHLVGGLDRRYSGKVRVEGRDLGGLDDRRLSAFRGATVGFVFQAFHLVPSLTALENVLLPAHFAAGGGSRAEQRARAAAALERVGLSGKGERRPGQLSGGERQRVAIARALFSRPSILLADEPTGNLDAATGGEVIELFRALNAEGMTLVLVTHEERVSRIAGRTLRLEGGRLEGGRLEGGRLVEQPPPEAPR